MTEPKLAVRVLLPVLLIGATAVILYLLVALKPSAKQRPQGVETALQVETVTVKVSDFPILMSSRGLVKAQTESTLAAEVSGTVVSVSEHFRKGGRFKKGDWLLTIDPRDYRVEVKLAEANLRQAQLALDEEDARADQALRDWQRLSQTLSRANVTRDTKNGETSSQTPPDLVLRKPQLAAAEAELSSRSAQLEQAKLDLERTRILAPFDGFVLNQTVDLGHYVAPGNPVADISGQTLEVILPISAQWRPLLNWQDTHDSDQGNVTLTVGQGSKRHRWLAKVMRDSGEVDRQSRQIQLIAEITPDPLAPWSLLPGDYAEAEIQAETLTDVVVLPRTALVDGQYVWTVDNQRLRKQPVTVLWRDAARIVVSPVAFDLAFVSAEKSSSAGQVGIDVVSSPLSYAISGTKVTIINRQPQPKVTEQ